MKNIKTFQVLFWVCALSLTLTHASPTTTPEPTEDATTTMPDSEPTTMPAAAAEAAEDEPADKDAMIIKDRYADAKKYPGFSRDCSNSNDCEYRNTLVKSTAYLNCANQVCICENNRNIADVSIWKLEWNGSTCSIAESGPCGVDARNDGELTMNCQQGLECVQGRCRDPMKLQQTPLNHSCNEDIDCVDGLVCKVTAFYFGPSSTCVLRETPALKGFEEEAGTSTTTGATTEGAADSSSTASSSSSSTTTPSATTEDQTTTSAKKEDEKE